ncbi:MAG: hypothetical protein JRH01_02045 [Deltaproteobacteria bacterium]|nr:hypothetical protein [Deltaproteobacteria bacterium]MBW2393538.1 hypothetical protein [Deltaproteobacteria bacterium]
MRTRGLVIFDAVSVTAFALVSVWVATRLGAPSEGSIGWIGLGALAGLAAADLATGAIHWIGDRCFRVSTPWIGRVLIQPFREHHGDPAAITRHGFLEVTGNNALLLLPVLALMAWFAPVFGHTAGASFGLAFLGAFAAAAVLSNPIHRWAHMRRVPASVAFLQRHRILLSPAHHARHHQGAHRTHFCVVTGWMNPLIDGLGRFRKRKPALSAAERPRATGSELGRA